MKLVLLVSFLMLAACATKTAEEEYNEKYQGSMDREGVRKVIRECTPEIKACYNQGLKKVPDDKGRISIRVEVNHKGNVLKSEVKESDLKNAEVGKCVADVIKKRHFPGPAEGVIAVIDFPFFLDKEPESK